MPGTAQQVSISFCSFPRNARGHGEVGSQIGTLDFGEAIGVMQQGQHDLKRPGTKWIADGGAGLP